MLPACLRRACLSGLGLGRQQGQQRGGACSWAGAAQAWHARAALFAPRGGPLPPWQSDVQRRATYARYQLSSVAGNPQNTVWGLIGLNVAGWYAWRSNPKFMQRHGVVSVQALRQGRYHTLLTSAFSHMSTNHLLSNMLGLYFMGAGVAATLGPQGLILLYSAGAVAGSVAHVASSYLQGHARAGEYPQYRDRIYSALPGALGASGAVCAIVLFDAILRPMQTVLLWGVLPLRLWQFAAGFVALDLAGFAQQQGGARSGSIAYAGHLGGVAVGALAGWRYKRLLRRRYW